MNNLIEVKRNQLEILKEKNMLWEELFEKPDNSDTLKAEVINLLSVVDAEVILKIMSNYLDTVEVVVMTSPKTDDLLPEEVKLLTHSIAMFKKKYPNVTAGDLQTYIIAYRDIVIQNRK